MAANWVRMDLARQVEVAQQILLAMQAQGPAHEGLERLVALTRAYLGNLYGDIRRPALDISIDDRLTVDWTHEVVVFRIVQMAVHNIWRHADASRIDLSMTAPDGALTVEVRDDGVGFEPDNVVPGTGILTMQALAGFVDGRVEIESSPGDGTRVCAVVGETPPPLPRRPRANGRPHLRLITSPEPS
jgi:signal transduction histidine kinase